MDVLSLSSTRTYATSRWMCQGNRTDWQNSVTDVLVKSVRVDFLVPGRLHEESHPFTMVAEALSCERWFLVISCYTGTDKKHPCVGFWNAAWNLCDLFMDWWRNRLFVWLMSLMSHQGHSCVANTSVCCMLVVKNNSSSNCQYRPKTHVNMLGAR